MSMYEAKSNAAFACSSKDAELNRERLNVEKTKRDLDLKVVHLESELEAQRSELTSAFEEQVRVRERDTQQRVDEAEAARLAHEMKVRQAGSQRPEHLRYSVQHRRFAQAKLLTNELEVLRSAQETVTSSFEERDVVIRQLEKDKTQLEFEVQNLAAVKDAQYDCNLFSLWLTWK